MKKLMMVLVAAMGFTVLAEGCSLSRCLISCPTGAERDYK